MRFALWSIPILCCMAAPAWGQDGERFVENTPLPLQPRPHTLERAGQPDTVGRWAVPAVSSHFLAGYVGGGSLRGNNPFVRGPAATSGAVGVGTFGSDFVGFRLRPGRIFLGASEDPSGASRDQRYRAESFLHMPDVLNIRPVRKAILAKKEAMEERNGGHGEHKESGDHKEAGEQKGTGEH